MFPREKRNEYLDIEGKWIMKECLEARGYNPTDDDIEELSQIYEDCQEWSEDGDMLTGNSYDEIEDFVKHSPCVDEVIKR